MRRVLLAVSGTVLLILLALSLGAVGAQAQNARLNGDYAFSGPRNCINSNLPFGPNYSVPPGAFTSRTVNVDTGITSYHGDGTGTVSFRSNNININVFPAPPLSGISVFPVSVSEGTCNLTYSVDHDGTVNRQASCTFTNTSGGGVGNTGTVTGIQTEGRIAQGNTAVEIGPSSPLFVETLTATTPGGATFTTFRVCVRSRVENKISPR